LLKLDKFKLVKKQYWRINEKIPSGDLRVIGSDGKQIGVITRDEALKKAKELSLDLIEVAPKAKPPVAKIIEFGKFKYQEEKKQKKAKKGIKTAELKEIRLSPFIAEADYKTRIGRINEFLSEGNKVRTVVKFKGRQMQSKQFGYDLLKKVLEDIEREVNIDMEPKFMGRHLAMVISPMGKAKKKEETEKEEGKNKTKQK